MSDINYVEAYKRQITEKTYDQMLPAQKNSAKRAIGRFSKYLLENHGISEEGPFHKLTSEMCLGYFIKLGQTEARTMHIETKQVRAEIPYFVNFLEDQGVVLHPSIITMRGCGIQRSLNEFTAQSASTQALNVDPSGLRADTRPSPHRSESAPNPQITITPYFTDSPDSGPSNLGADPSTSGAKRRTSQRSSSSPDPRASKLFRSEADFTYQSGDLLESVGNPPQGIPYGQPPSGEPQDLPPSPGLYYAESADSRSFASSGFAYETSELEFRSHSGPSTPQTGVSGPSTPRTGVSGPSTSQVRSRLHVSLRPEDLTDDGVSQSIPAQPEASGNRIWSAEDYYRANPRRPGSLNFFAGYANLQQPRPSSSHTPSSGEVQRGTLEAVYPGNPYPVSYSRRRTPSPDHTSPVESPSSRERGEESGVRGRKQGDHGR